jgi:hypothetical protein
MKQVALFCFLYGCLASAGAFGWYWLALTGHATLPQNAWMFEVPFLAHVAVMVATFQRLPSRKIFKPVLKVTPARIRGAQLLLLVSAANFGLCAARVFWESAASSERTLSMVVTSLVLLNTVYVAIHWALRPENLFPGGFLAFMRNPLVYLFFRSPRRYGK